MRQERTIMGACDYSLATLNGIKKKLMVIDDKDKAINWAIGGIVITLTSHLLKLCNDRFLDASISGEPNAIEDIKFIQDKFNFFIDRMVDQD